MLLFPAASLNELGEALQMQFYFLFVELYSNSPRDKIQYSDAQFNYDLKDPKVVPSIYKLIGKNIQTSSIVHVYILMSF